MKKFISILLVAALAVGCLCGCGNVSAKNLTSGRLSVVTTIFPEYDWVKNILGENPGDMELTMLLDTGVDLHSFQPTTDDIMKISDCDLFIYVGGESDGWVDDVLQEATNKNMKVINPLDVLGEKVKEEEVVEGMQEEEHHHDEAEAEEHEEEHDHDHDHEEGPEYDEHVWLSLRHASVLTEEIASTLAEIDPANASTYQNNARSYQEKLAQLDLSYRDVTEQASVNTLLFGDRFPFRYLTDDYDLSYYAAFVGCSAESEASFETITFLAQKVDELNLSAVMTIEGTDKSIAETVIANTQKKDQKILTLDSMQSVTAKDVEEGADYLSIMEQNLAVLKEALQ